MATTKPSDQFVFEGIADFDARRAYKRCKLPGVGVSFAGDRRTASANLWRDQENNVVTRFSSQGYEFSFRVRDASGKPLRDDQVDPLGEYLCDLLVLWIVEGVDDTPTTEPSGLPYWKA
jgi:hypothetical protein